MKKIIVTGGAGFLGSHLVDLLLEEGYHVYVLDDLSSGNESNLSRWTDMEDDIQDMRSLYKYSPGKRPRLEIKDIDITNKFVENPWLSDIDAGDVDCIFHMAARMDVMTSFKDPFDDGMRNYIGTLNVLEFARKIECPKVVYRSSFTVYSEDNDLPLTETAKKGPISPYAMHKLFSEDILELYNRHYGMKNLSFRLFNLYGPRQDPGSIYSGVVVQFLAKALKKNNLPVYGDGEQTRDFIYVKDAVRAMYEGFRKDAVGVYNVGTGKETTINQLVSEISEILGRKIITECREGRKGEICRSVADLSRLKEDLGFYPDTNLKKGLIETLDWMKKHG